MSFRHRGPCHYCGVRFEAHELTKDHVVPRSRGGHNARWNIVAACQPCNVKKGDSWPTCDCEFCRESVRRHFDFHFISQRN